jgi:peptidoglycan biosynthesis protein MviN/MurJ (putative lipid II flippase)
MMVPHSVITVSLGTALLPRLSDHASDGNLALVRDRLVSGIRICLAVIVPVAALVAALSGPLVALLFDHGAATGQTGVLALTVTALVPGLIAFTVHYLVLRGFYAVQDTRTPFFVQLWVAGTMVVSALLVAAVAPPRATVLLAIGYSVAYVIGAAVSLSSLGRRLDGLRRWPLLLHILRLALPAGLAAALAYGVATALGDLVDRLPAWLANLVLVAAGGSVGLLAFIGVAYLIRIVEVREAVTLVRRRLSRTRPSMDRQSRGADGTDGGNYP